MAVLKGLIILIQLIAKQIFYNVLSDHCITKPIILTNFNNLEWKTAGLKDTVSLLVVIAEECTGTTIAGLLKSTLSMIN